MSPRTYAAIVRACTSSIRAEIILYPQTGCVTKVNPLVAALFRPGRSPPATAASDVGGSRSSTLAPSLACIECSVFLPFRIPLKEHDEHPTGRPTGGGTSNQA